MAMKGYSTFSKVKGLEPQHQMVWVISGHTFFCGGRGLLHCRDAVTVPRARTIIDYNCYFHVPRFFQFPSKVQVLILLFTFFQFLSVVSKVHNSASSLFFVDYNKVWLCGWDQVICLYFKIPKKFVHLILQERCWVVHIPFIHMVKFKFLAQFPLNHLSYPVVSSLILFLCQFAAFA